MSNYCSCKHSLCTGFVKLSTRSRQKPRFPQPIWGITRRPEPIFLFGSNGLDWNRYWKGFHEMKLRDDTLKAVMYDNPKRVFGL